MPQVVVTEELNILDSDNRQILSVSIQLPHQFQELMKTIAAKFIKSILYANSKRGSEMLVGTNVKHVPAVPFKHNGNQIIVVVGKTEC